jgi:hypothetical protein
MPCMPNMMIARSSAAASPCSCVLRQGMLAPEYLIDIKRLTS